MKKPTITAKDWRMIRLGLFVLVPLLFYVKGVKPYRARLTELHTETDNERDLLVRERNAVETAKQNPLLQVTTDSAYRELEPRLFEGRDDAIAASEVQNYLMGVAYENQVYVLPETKGGVPAKLSDGVRALRVELRAESDLQGFLGFLRGIEHGDKLITVERLDITKASKGLGGATAADGIEKLSMTATITGYALGVLSSAKTKKAPGATTTTPKPPVVGKGMN